MGNICGDSNHSTTGPSGSRSNQQRQMRSVMEGIGGKWPGGKIYYLNLINPQISEVLYVKVQNAIQKWNQWNAPHCEFVVADITSQYCVNFIENQKGVPESQVGCWRNSQQYISLPQAYANGNPLRVACILHEMMHCVGFRHEGQDIPSFINWNAIPLGGIDQFSLMHLGHQLQGNYPQFPEVQMRADSGDIFSLGDLAAIKILYTQSKRHHGVWHKPCDPRKGCTKTYCNCDGCLTLPNGLNCGYTGEMQGHWTCCLNEEKNSECNTHAGFWHAECYDRKCNDRLCYCNNCINSCQYVGRKGHWSCCLKDYKWAECTLTPFRN
eukprot:403347849